MQIVVGNGIQPGQPSPNGRIPLGTEVITPAVDGSTVQLTLDADMQWMVEQRLAEQVKATNGVWAVAVVMDVESGQLLSLANYPSFDSNDQGTAKEADLRSVVPTPCCWSARRRRPTWATAPPVRSTSRGRCRRS